MSSLYLEYGVRLVFLFALGAVLGSLLNVCIYRLPETERFWPALRTLVYPPSRCPRCLHAIPWYDNIPIFGWLKLWGRCRFCRTRIPVRYALIELLTGVLFVLVYWFEIPPWPAGIKESCVYHLWGPQDAALLAGWSEAAVMHWRYAFHIVLILALIVATFIDFDHWIIPDTVTLPAMTAGILGSWLFGHMFLVPLWFQSPRAISYQDLYRLFFENRLPPQSLPAWLSLWLSFKGRPDWIITYPHWHGLLVSLAGIIVGGGVVWAVRAVGYWVLKREAMGFGDVVLMAMIGSFLGWQASLVVFFLAPICALTVVIFSWLIWRNREIPYGPYLSMATLVTLLGWRHIWPPVEERIFALGPFLPIAGLVMFLSLASLLFISRMIQRLFGIEPPPDEEWEEGWGAGDQLAYLAGECTDAEQGQWPANRWPGKLSGRGLVQQREWRHSAGTAWQNNWQRRKT